MLSFTLQIIDLKRDPYGTLDKRGKPTIKTFGNVPKNPLQTMEDKLRIANKVSKKYKELMNELDENIKQVMEEIGNDEEANLLLAKGPPSQPEKSELNFLKNRKIYDHCSGARARRTFYCFLSFGFISNWVVAVCVWVPKCIISLLF